MTQDAFQQLQHRSPDVVRVPHLIEGREYFDGPVKTRNNPSHPSELVSEFHSAPQTLVDRAVAVSRTAQRIWQEVPIDERVRIVRQAIPYVEQNIDSWAVRVALEIGKPWEHARTEALETLQFLKIYSEYAQTPGYFEDPRQEVGPDRYTRGAVINDSVKKPYGVFGVITPFNYPIALASGPAIAAVLAGNGVVVKSSSQAPWSGLAVQEMFNYMDLPTGLVNTIHGGGRELVKSSVDGIAFTGSYETGAHIASVLNDGPYPRPLIAEMGGKNPVIVTGSADLQEAAQGIAFSAFDLTGQKCSALSRVLVTADVHDELVELVARELDKFTLGAPESAAVLGPAVDQAAVAKYDKIMELADEEHLDVQLGAVAPAEGYFTRPALISNVPSTHRLAREEHFLPVLTVSKVANIEEAIAAANSVEYGLTAGIYTGDEAEARAFINRIESGCINVNIRGHAVTGWWPGPQTFGGWKGSGSTGTHGFGRWYMLQFARQQARKVPAALAHLLE